MATSTRDVVRSRSYLAVVVDPPRVPRAPEAVVPEAKLAWYALDPTHPRGRHKARVFSATLGIE